MNDVEHQPGEASPPADASPETKMRWTAVPRWVKVFVITALGLALLMVVAMLLSALARPGRTLVCWFDATGVGAKDASFVSGDDASVSGR